MAALAEAEDVVARLGRPLTADELTLVPGWLSRADRLVRAWLRCVPDPVPEDVRDTVADIVERAVRAAASGATPEVGVTSVTQAYGPFSQQRGYSSDASSGSVFLSRQDRLALAPYRCPTRAAAVRTW